MARVQHVDDGARGELEAQLYAQDSGEDHEQHLFSGKHSITE